MSADIITLPGAAPPDRPITESDIEALHAEAFRDLENRMMDCVSMAKIAFDRICDHKTEDRELVFAVAHAWELLEKLKKRLLRRLPRRAAGRIAYLLDRVKTT
jgi:hypothetical protein